MIRASAVSARAAMDGDVVTCSVLAALCYHEVDPIAEVRPTNRPVAAPVEVARPSQCSREVRAAARAWLVSRPNTIGQEAQQEEMLLHAIETAALTRPPVTLLAQSIDDELASIYLGLARHWISYARHVSDPRFLSAALKLCAASLLAPIPVTRLACATVADAIEALDRLPALRGRPSVSPPAPCYQRVRTKIEIDTEPVRITVLAGAESSGLPLFLAAAAKAQLTIGSIILHAPSNAAPPQDSVYANAWYPRRINEVSISQGAGYFVHGRRSAHEDWGAVRRAVKKARTDLLVLLGMGIVPADILELPRLSTINAHNGALPDYRGMDAVAWALLAGDPVVCSVHVATPDVDAGDVLAETRVSTDTSDLRRDVKYAQIALLTKVCQETAFRGTVPAGRVQSGTGRRHYRMHPALRRLLEGRTADLKETYR